MPETQDTKNATDQGRSGGRQTQESDRPGQGATQATNPDSGIQNRDAAEPHSNAGYGKQSGMQGAAAQQRTENSPESGGQQGQLSEDQKLREIAKNSNHPGNPAEEWSPGSHQPNT